MDGTLLLGDVSVMGFRAALAARPHALLSALPLLLTRRAAFKQRLATLGPLDVGALPLRQAVIAHLAAEKARGRMLHLATGADEHLAHAVAARLGFFTRVFASDGRTNLTGPRKAACLVAAFPDGFVYAGDSAMDLHVWRVAAGAVLVNVSDRVARAVGAMQVPVEARF
jgi:hypothetical protein